MKNEKTMVHCGIATFVGGDYVSLDEIGDYDITVLGVPDEMGLSYRTGTIHAPRKIREYSMWKRIDGMECYDYDNKKFVQTNDLTVCDLGDLDIYNGDQMKSLASLQQVVKAIREKSFPLILGGDHSITYGSFAGVKQGGAYKNLGLIHFDAHNDTEPDDEFLPEINHSNQFTRLITDGHVQGKNMISMGLRGIVDRRWHDFAMENGINIITANDFNAQSVEATLAAIQEAVKDCDAVYVSFDMDSLEAAYSSGVGTPKYNGLQIMKVLEVLRGLKTVNVVAFDLVELNPQHDATGISSYTAWEILYNFLAVGLNKGI